MMPIMYNNFQYFGHHIEIFLKKVEFLNFLICLELIPYRSRSAGSGKMMQTTYNLCARYNLCPIQFVPRYNLLQDTICARYSLCPIQFVSDTNCADTNCADTICADTICSRYNLCRYNLYMNPYISS
jgi:hypothetical protein